MNNFIEINLGDNQALINLNFVTSIRHKRYYPNDLYTIYLIEDEYYNISKEQYDAIKAKLIDNDSKERYNLNEIYGREVKNFKTNCKYNQC